MPPYPVWYMIPHPSASQSFTQDTLCERKSNNGFSELLSPPGSYFGTLGKIIAIRLFVGYGFMIGSSKFAWLLKT